MIKIDTPEEKNQVALNMLNAYNLKESYKNGTQSSWVNLTQLPDGLCADEAIMRYYPVYPKGHIANCGSVYGLNINVED